MDKCQEVFEHGKTAREKADETEQDSETQIDPKERVLKCPNSRRCMLGKICFYRGAPQEHADRTYDASNHLTQWVRFHPQNSPMLLYIEQTQAQVKHRNP